MTTRTRTPKAPNTTPVPAKKTAVKRAPATGTRTPRSRARQTTHSTPKLSLVKRPKVSLVRPRKPLPARPHPFMTDLQGYATLASRIAGILTPRITEWVDHHDGTATRALKDGTLHYTLNTRTLSWQATCLTGAVHTYPIPTPGAAAEARILAARCTDPHADLSQVPALTPDELEALGLLQTPTWARPDLIGDAHTESIPVPLPDRQPRALADQLAHSGNDATDTQPISLDDINAALAAGPPADTDQMKEHPQP